MARMPHEMAEAHTEYCLRESEWFIKGSVLALDQRSRIAWMSHPANIQMAESKLYQLSTANSLGFKLPETLVSNDPGEVRDFFTKKQGKIIAKPLGLGYFDYGDHQTSVYTNLVEWKHLQDDNSIRVSPVIFQELIPKRFDIRITIVGKRVFAVAIDSQSVESAKIDWRRTDTPELPHIIHDLPPSLEAKCLEYMLALGLNYGALDFVVTPDEEYIFLEINPNGQWVWMEDMLGLPISESIAAWLQDHAGN
jgi:glutathione synthase/RimK-type ligase-like ATP-grasp enzyme